MDLSERRLHGLPPPLNTRPSTSPLTHIILTLSSTSSLTFYSLLLTNGITSSTIFTPHSIALSSPFAGEALTYLLRRKYSGTGRLAGDVSITAANFDSILGERTIVIASVENGLACLAPELIAAYPSARVILLSVSPSSSTTTDAESAESAQNLIKKWYNTTLTSPLLPFSSVTSSFDPNAWKAWARGMVVRELYWLREVQKITCGMPFWQGEFEDTGIWKCREWEGMIRGICASKGIELEEWRVGDSLDVVLGGGNGKGKEVLVNGKEGTVDGDDVVRKERAEAIKVVRDMEEMVADKRLALIVAIVCAAFGIVFGIVVFQLDLGAVKEPMGGEL